MDMSGSKSFFVLFLYFSIVSRVFAQQAVDISAYRLEKDEQIKLDGRLEESFWTKVEAASAFRQQEPLEGQLATEQYRFLHR